MANWNTLKTAVADVINANGNQAITGQLLQNVLNNIITNVGENATFAGIATLDTNPGAPDGSVFYLTATAGTYPNFNGIEVQDGEAVILLWNNNAWSKKVTGFATQEKLSELGQKVIKIEGVGSLGAGNSGITGNNQYFISSYNGKLYKSSNYESSTSFNVTEVPYIDGMIIVYKDEIMLVVDGATVVFMKDTIDSLTNSITQEIKRATNAETMLSYKIIELVGFGSTGSGDSGVTGNNQYYFSTIQKKIYKSSNYESPTKFSSTEIPYVDGAIYLYNNEVFLWDGDNLVVSTEKISKTIKVINRTLSTIDYLLGGIDVVDFNENAFINLSVGVGSVVNMEATPNNGYRYGAVDVVENEIYILNVVGGSNARAYGFVDSNNVLLEVAGRVVTLNNYKIIAPKNASKLIVNDNNSQKCFAYKYNVIDELREDVKEIKQDIETDLKPFHKEYYTQAFIDSMAMVWNANYAASYNTIESLTEKISGMKCRAVWNESVDGSFTSVAIISNPNGVHNIKGSYPDLNDKIATHINKKSIHPTFTNTACQLGIMLNGNLEIKHNISYDNPIKDDGITEYLFGWDIDSEGITVLTPDGKTHRFLNTEDGVDYMDYCGKYCCFEFFNNREDKKSSAQPQIKRVEITQSDGFIIYDNFIRPNGLLGLTPSGFIWHQSSSAEGYYSYR